VVNLDPAAEVFKYRCDIDIRDLISLEDVQEELKLGPNGGLVYCMEYLVENIEWLTEELNEFADDCFVIFDCPGQIELYSHLNVMPKLAKTIAGLGYQLSAVYCADGTFVGEPAKYISACLTSVSTMISLQLPHINVLTKCDKVKDQELLDTLLDLNAEDHLGDSDAFSTPQLRNLHKHMIDLIDNFNMVRFMPLNILDEESIKDVAY
jgi:GTPase SAR1 family protein